MFAKRPQRYRLVFDNTSGVMYLPAEEAGGARSSRTVIELLGVSEASLFPASTRNHVLGRPRFGQQEDCPGAWSLAPHRRDSFGTSIQVEWVPEPFCRDRFVASTWQEGELTHLL
jgi:hypothetical protein